MMFRILMPIGVLATFVATPIAAQVVTVATVKVASGPHAGTYPIESEVGCRISRDTQTGHLGFRANLESKAIRLGRGVVPPNEVSILHVAVPNMDTPAGRSEVEAQVSFGDPMSRKTASTTYHVNTRPIDGLDTLVAQHDRKRTVDRKPKGRGGATLKQKADTAVLEFWEETTAGVRIDGTIDCRQVDRY